MAETNKEIVGCLENDAWVAAWDKGEDEPDSIVTRCEDCVFKDWRYIIEVNEIYCNKLKKVMEHNDFCSYGVRYNIDDE